MNLDQDADFYRECAEILGTSYDCEGFPYRYRTRWNNRAPGNGRFPGYGLIRLFGDQVQIALHHPVKLQQNVSTRTEALRILKEALASNSKS